MIHMSRLVSIHWFEHWYEQIKHNTAHKIKTKTILDADAAFDKISIWDNSLEETGNRIIPQCNKGMYDQLCPVLHYMPKASLGQELDKSVPFRSCEELCLNS